jgi:hypothetical protein
MTSLQCGGSTRVALVRKLGIAGPCGRRSTPGRLDSDLGLATPAGHLRLATAAAALDGAAAAALHVVAAAALDGAAAAAALAGVAAPGFGGRYRGAAVLRHNDASVKINNSKDQKINRKPKRSMVEFALQSARAVMTGHGRTCIFCSFFKNCYFEDIYG